MFADGLKIDLKVQKSQNSLPMSSHASLVQRIIKAFPTDRMCLSSPSRTFKTQSTRLQLRKRPSSTSQFLSSNFHFVYKNVSMLAGDKNETKLIEELNDVLFNHALFPDTMVNWDLLFCTITHQNEDYVCPICLFTPVCPVMTPCGHIFCGDCMHQYLDSTEKHVCPVCSEPFPISRVIRTQIVFHDAKTAKFRRMSQNHNETLAFPMRCRPSTLPFASDPAALYNKFSIVDKKFAEKLKEDNLSSLMMQSMIYEEYADPIKNEYIEKERELVLNQQIPEDCDVVFKITDADQCVEYFQSSDGRAMFLDDLVTKALTQEFGSISMAPSEVEGNIVSSKIVTVTEESNYHRGELMRYPPGSEVEFVVIDISHLLTKKKAEFLQNLKRISSKPVKRQKKKVITRADYQTFIPLEPETEISLDSPEAFPSLSELSSKSKSKIKSFQPKN